MSKIDLTGRYSKWLWNAIRFDRTRTSLLYHYADLSLPNRSDDRSLGTAKQTVLLHIINGLDDSDRDFIVSRYGLNDPKASPYDDLSSEIIDREMLVFAKMREALIDLTFDLQWGGRSKF